MTRNEIDRPGPLSETEARRAFLKRCGRYAVVTPPAVTVMLAAATRPSAAKGLYRWPSRRSHKGRRRF